ncbi:hypothetical protein [Thermococcus prieurii]
MRKVLSVAVALLIVLGAVAGAVYAGCIREPGREVIPRNDEDSPDPESILIKFLERPSDELLKSRIDEESKPRLPEVHLPEFTGSLVPLGANSHREPQYQRTLQASRWWGTEAALLGLLVGAFPPAMNFLEVGMSCRFVRWFYKWNEMFSATVEVVAFCGGFADRVQILKLSFFSLKSWLGELPG